MARRRGSPVNSTMSSGKPPGPFATHRGSLHLHEQGYESPPFASFRHDRGPNDMPCKVREHHGEVLPKDHPPGQVSPDKPKGTPSSGRRRF
jgi:hypothetical protein